MSQPPPRKPDEVFARPPPTARGNVSNHPLANVAVEYSAHQRPPPQPTIAQPPPPPTRPPSDQPKTIDDWANDFLSADNESNANLFPHPLPAEASDLERLKLLVSLRAWEQVYELANRLRNANNSHYTPLYQGLLNGQGGSEKMALQTHQDDLAYILTVLLHSLIKLRKPLELFHQLERWTFVFHNSGVKGWLPYSLHICAAAALQFTVPKDADQYETTQRSRNAAALDALHAIRADIPSHDVLSQCQVEDALCQVFMRCKSWRMALLCLQRMITIVVAATEQAELGSCYKVHLLSRQGRMLLQAGASDQARLVFEQARTVWNEVSSSLLHGASKNQDAVVMVPAQLCVNEGLLQFSFSQYQDALHQFRHAANLLRPSLGSNNTVNTTTDLFDNRHVSHVIVGGTPDTLYTEAINNMAMSSVYTCQLDPALREMERLVRMDVPRYLTDRVALNLCTLYELASDSNTAGRNKKVLQSIARRFHLADIGNENFRVS